MEKGRIIRIISNQYMVRNEAGENLICVAMGKLRKNASPIVGDLVDIEHFSSQIGIQKIYPRRNELQRPLVANVDQAIIVMSYIEPTFSTTLVDRLIFLVAYAGIKPLICVTKMDLVKPNDPIYNIIEDYRKSGYEVFESGKGMDDRDLFAAIDHKTSVLTGQSGAGKSSLLNRMEPKFHLQTQAISKALGRGKHTTRHCELLPVAHGWIADTPGFSSLDFTNMDLTKLAACIPDFQKEIGNCRFHNCVHVNEPDCAIAHAVDIGEISKIRYRNYLDIAQIIKSQPNKYK
ncbi:MAG: ribosome small subunit-dependent GTPase A [Erysipelotrichaceae bacterium]